MHFRELSERLDQYLTFQCPICCHEFEEVKLKNHISDHNIKSPYDCPVCKKQLTDDEIISSHLMKEAQKYRCNICLSLLASHKSLKNHIKRHFAEIPCRICDKIFKTDKELQIHMATQHHQGPYCCNICKTACFTKNSLKSHLLTHKENATVNNIFACSMCDKSFNKDCSLKNHVRQVHTKSGTRFVCQICGITLHSNRYLQLHMSVHATAKAHKCDECGKHFSTKGTLAIHSRTHSGIRPYVCQLCDKEFTQLSVLKTHLTIHTGEKPFCCKICDKRFSTKSQLKIHLQRVHSSVD